MSKIKSEEEIATELCKLPKTSKPREEPITNRICSCGRKIGNEDTYYILIEPGEMPQVFCEMCISIRL